MSEFFYITIIFIVNNSNLHYAIYTTVQKFGVGKIFYVFKEVSNAII